MEEIEKKTLKEVVKEVKEELIRKGGPVCNCDLDNWQPEITTGHSWVCRIHRIATERYRNQKSLGYGNGS